MTDTATEAHQTTLLRIFKALADGERSASPLRKKLGLGAKEGADAEDADRALSALIEQGLVAVVGGAKDGLHPRTNASYRLTEAGRHQLRPSKPEISDELLQAQEAFILLQVFRSKDQTLTRSELVGKLKTKAAMGNLEFNVKDEPETVDYHLASLVEKGSLVRERRGASFGYRLDPEKGAGALAAVKQHDAVTFTMSGETLNALLEAARGSVPAESVASELPAIEEPTIAATVPMPEPQDIERYIDRLRSDRFAGKDQVPIHEVRRLVAEHHGEEAASHPAFDPLLKRMRSEGQLRLIAISDNRDATQEQLDDSIPGMNETLFYIVPR